MELMMMIMWLVMGGVIVNHIERYIYGSWYFVLFCVILFYFTSYHYTWSQQSLLVETTLQYFFFKLPFVLWNLEHEHWKFGGGVHTLPQKKKIIICYSNHHVSPCFFRMNPNHHCLADPTSRDGPLLVNLFFIFLFLK